MILFQTFESLWQTLCIICELEMQQVFTLQKIYKKSPQPELEVRRGKDELLEFRKWIKLESFIFYINQDVIFRPRIPISSRTALKLDLLSQLLFL